ncbi:TadE family protein [Nocardiopsis protaetiae]
MIVALPLAFTMLLGIVQYTLWTHAHHRAQAIATEALAGGRVFNGTEHGGEERGHALADDLGGTLLRDTAIDVRRQGGTTHVTVDATTVGLLPGWNPGVHVSLTGPTEHVERP